LNSGVITAIVFSAKLGASPSMQTLYSARNYYTAFSLFWGGSSWSSVGFPASSKLTFFFLSGLVTGCCNLLCSSKLFLFDLPDC
jgi:hypothetical protein